MSDSAVIHEKTGFDIGWDYVVYGVPFPMPMCAADGRFKCIVDGYKASTAHFRTTSCPTVKTPEALRWRTKWMSLRVSALKRNRIVTKEVTSEYLLRINVDRCPVTRAMLTHRTGLPTDASIERMNNQGGYAIGNLCVISVLANKAKGGLSFQNVLKTALSLAPGAEYKGLNQHQWGRLACLSSYVAGPEDGPVVETLPLICLPPPGCLLNNAVQQLQFLSSGFMNPNLPAKNNARIIKAYSALKDKRVMRALDDFVKASSFSVNEAYKKASPPYLCRGLAEDAWEMPALYAFWTDLREKVAGRANAVVHGFGANPGVLIKAPASSGIETWGLESGGQGPASEW